MDKQISGREEKVRTQALTHMQMYRVIKAPFGISNSKSEDSHIENQWSVLISLIFSSFNTVISSFFFFFFFFGVLGLHGGF